jgi:hypothetical protein
MAGKVGLSSGAAGSEYSLIGGTVKPDLSYYRLTAAVDGVLLTTDWEGELTWEEMWSAW